MRIKDLKERTQQFALNCCLLCDKLPNTRGFNAYVNQLIRCSSSVGANYRASQRAKSTADFINKLKIVEEEVDESMYFLELLNKISVDCTEEINALHHEAEELLSITVASINTAKSKR